jgi:hypothetical protein
VRVCHSNKSSTKLPKVWLRKKQLMDTRRTGQWISKGNPSGDPTVVDGGLAGLLSVIY